MISTSDDESSKRPTDLPNPPVDMPRVVPHLFYKDVAAAIDWLVDTFGFVVRNRMEDKNGKVFHGDLEIADSLVMLGLAEEHDHWVSPQEFVGKSTQRLFIYVDDVDAHYERTKAAGAKIRLELGDQWHGERVYEAIDLEGHHWKFAQPIFEVDQHNLQRPS